MINVELPVFSPLSSADININPEKLILFTKQTMVRPVFSPMITPDTNCPVAEVDRAEPGWEPGEGSKTAHS